MPKKTKPVTEQEPAFFQATYDLNSSELTIGFRSADCSGHVHMNSRKVQKLFGRVLSKNWLELLPVLGMYAQQAQRAKPEKKGRKTKTGSFCGGIDKELAKKSSKAKKTARTSPAAPPAP